MGRVVVPVMHKAHKGATKEDRERMFEEYKAEMAVDYTAIRLTHLLAGIFLMSKYTETELQAMAETAEEARKKNDPRYLALLITMSQKTGLNPGAVRVKIQELAVYGQTN